jgi:hypothetical protein
MIELWCGQVPPVASLTIAHSCLIFTEHWPSWIIVGLCFTLVDLQLLCPALPPIVHNLLSSMYPWTILLFLPASLPQIVLNQGTASFITKIVQSWLSSPDQVLICVEGDVPWSPLPTWSSQSFCSTRFGGVVSGQWPFASPSLIPSTLPLPSPPFTRLRLIHFIEDIHRGKWGCCSRHSQTTRRVLSTDDYLPRDAPWLLVRCPSIYTPGRPVIRSLSIRKLERFSPPQKRSDNDFLMP